MKQFIRDNPTLAFGLGLPLLIALVFALAAGLPNLFVDDPRYDVVLSSGNSQSYEFHVINGRLEASYKKLAYDQATPKLYIYTVKTGALREIALPVPPQDADSQTAGNNKANRRIPISMPEMESLKLDASTKAPDGYSFLPYDSYSGGGEVTRLFFMPSYRQNGSVLRKGGHRVAISDPEYEGRYNARRFQFIGWVIPQ